jgi:hypothetical protein
VRVIFVQYLQTKKNTMKKNIGTVDRVIRILVAVAVVALFFANIISGTMALILLALSVIFVVTSIISICPIYSFMRLSTLKENKVKL